MWDIQNCYSARTRSSTTDPTHGNTTNGRINPPFIHHSTIHRDRPSLFSRSLFRSSVSRLYHPDFRIHKETLVPSESDTPLIRWTKNITVVSRIAQNDDKGEPGIPPPPPPPPPPGCTLPLRPRKKRRYRPGNCLHRIGLGRLPYDSLLFIELKYGTNLSPFQRHRSKGMWCGGCRRTEYSTTVVRTRNPESKTRTP